MIDDGVRIRRNEIVTLGLPWRQAQPVGFHSVGKSFHRQSAGNAIVTLGLPWRQSHSVGGAPTGWSLGGPEFIAEEATSFVSFWDVSFWDEILTCRNFSMSDFQACRNFSMPKFQHVTMAVRSVRAALRVLCAAHLVRSVRACVRKCAESKINLYRILLFGMYTFYMHAYCS